MSIDYVSVLGWQIVLILCLLDQLGCKVAVLDVVMFVDMDFQNKLIDSLSRFVVKLI
jgi:hypothetical protein